jgi:outer membrane biogenesis lipoprotein LolB
MRFALIAITLLVLAGCANVFIHKDTNELTYNEYLNNLPKNALEDFKATAKFNFYEDDKVISGKINWSSKNNKDIILILNPFNGIEAKIELDLISKNQNIKLATDQAKNKKLNSFLEKKSKSFFNEKVHSQSTSKVFKRNKNTH